MLRYLSIIFTLLLFIWGCSEEEAFTVTDIDIPLNCTIPGELELDGETTNRLKKYEKLDNDLTPKASPVNPKKYKLN